MGLLRWLRSVGLRSSSRTEWLEPRLGSELFNPDAVASAAGRAEHWAVVGPQGDGRRAVEESLRGAEPTPHGSPQNPQFPLKRSSECFQDPPIGVNRTLASFPCHLIRALWTWLPPQAASQPPPRLEDLAGWLLGLWRRSSKSFYTGTLADSRIYRFPTDPEAFLLRRWQFLSIASSSGFLVWFALKAPPGWSPAPAACSTPDPLSLGFKRQLGDFYPVWNGVQVGITTFALW